MRRLGSIFAKKNWLRAALVGFVILDFLTPEFGMFQARAQSGAACPIGAPVTQTVTSYNLTNNDECSAIIFTSAIPVTVTAPAANTVAPGYQVMIIAINGGVTLTSASSNINSASTGVVIGPGQSGLLYGDGNAYWFANGAGFASGPPNSVFAALARSPGTLGANSSIGVLPNAIIQFTNPASFLQGGYAFGACGAAPPAFGAGASGSPRSSVTPSNWLQILDPFSKLRLIPLCNPNP